MCRLIGAFRLRSIWVCKPEKSWNKSPSSIDTRFRTTAWAGGGLANPPERGSLPLIDSNGGVKRLTNLRWKPIRLCLFLGCCKSTREKHQRLQVLWQMQRFRTLKRCKDTNFKNNWFSSQIDFDGFCGSLIFRHLHCALWLSDRFFSPSGYNWVNHTWDMLMKGHLATHSS